MVLNRENVANDILADLAARNENWEELDSVLTYLSGAAKVALWGSDVIPYIKEVSVVPDFTSGGLNPAAASSIGRFLSETRVVVLDKDTAANKWYLGVLEEVDGVMVPYCPRLEVSAAWTTNKMVAVDDSHFLIALRGDGYVKAGTVTPAGITLTNVYTLTGSTYGAEMCWILKEKGYLALHDQNDKKMKLLRWNGSTLTHGGTDLVLSTDVWLDVYMQSIGEGRILLSAPPQGESTAKLRQFYLQRPQNVAGVDYQMLEAGNRRDSLYRPHFMLSSSKFVDSQRVIDVTNSDDSIMAYLYSHRLPKDRTLSGRILVLDVYTTPMWGIDQLGYGVALA